MPKSNKDKTVTFRTTKERDEQLTSEAERLDRTKGELLNAIVARYFKDKAAKEQQS